MSLEIANHARLEKLLACLIRTSAYGVVTYREFITRCIADGGHVASAEVIDGATRNKLQREYDAMNRGFNVPWGNACHPTTIKAQMLKDRLKGSIMATEYRLYSPKDAHWSIIPKMLHDWALTQ